MEGLEKKKTAPQGSAWQLPFPPQSYSSCRSQSSAAWNNRQKDDLPELFVDLLLPTWWLHCILTLPLCGANSSTWRVILWIQEKDRFHPHYTIQPQKPPLPFPQPHPNIMWLN